MHTINTILDTSPDGTLHLPLPEELGRGRFRIAARVEPLDAASLPAEENEVRGRAILSLLQAIRERDPFREIDDPVTWQRLMRQDRALPPEA